MGDFSYQSNDVNNQGIGFDRSVSWTSGNGGSLDLYNDSYYNNYGGSSDYNWFMGDWESDRNEIGLDDEEEW